MVFLFNPTIIRNVYNLKKKRRFYYLLSGEMLKQIVDTEVIFHPRNFTANLE